MNWTAELKTKSAAKLYSNPEHRTCVYQFRGQTKYGAEVIVKQVACESEVQAQKAEAEAKIVIDYPHPQINQCLGYEREPKPGGGFYVYIFAVPMPQSLFDDITSRASVERFYSEEELWGFYRSLLEPLHHLQCLGISHRDIKPHNILLDSQGCIKLCDFGYAKKIDKQAPGEHSLLGSALYWSPLLREAHFAGTVATVQHNPFKSDVFSLGLTLVNLTLLALPKPLENLACLQQFIDAELNGIRMYSQSWVELLRSMLRVDEAHRPDFIALRTPALYEDDEELPPVLGGEVCEQPLQLSAKCGYKYVRVSEQRVDEVPCMITIQACSQPLGQRTYGMDLICVIDQSGSMEGIIMNLVKTSLNGLLTRLNDRDRMALVGFNDVAERKCQLIRCNEEGKCRLRGLIQVLNCRGMTNIAKGFQMGLEVLKRRRTVNQASSLLLFSDGCNNMDGDPTLPCMSALQHCDLSQFTVCTFGFGCDLDSKLLEALANTKKGQFQHITQEHQIPEVFNYALGHITTVVARNLEVSISLLPGSVSCTTKIYSKEGGNVFELPDLHANEQKELIFMLKPTYQSLIKKVSYPAVQVTLRFTDTEDTESTKWVNLDVKFMKLEGTSKAPEDRDVFRHWYRVQGADCLRQARELASSGDFAEADRLLCNGVELLQASGYTEVPLVHEVQKHMIQAKEMVQSEKSWKKGGDPYFASVSYSHFEQSATALTRYYATPQQRGNDLANVEKKPGYLES